MKCKRIISGLALSLMLVLSTLLTSCIPTIKPDIIQDSTTKTEDNQVEIRFISSWGGVDPIAETLQVILDKFMSENKDITVINDSMYGEEFLPLIKSNFASGNDPDVFGIWPGSDIRALVNSDRVADLTELLNKDEEWKQSFGDSMWRYTTYNDKIYGLPLQIIYECLFINKEMFDRYSVKVPKTYEELLEAVQIFKTNDIIPIAYNYSAEGTYIYQNIAARLGGKDNIESPYRNGKFNQCFVDAMKYMKELHDAGAFPPDTTLIGLSDNDRNNLFLKKQAAMIVQGSWFIRDIKKNFAEDKVLMMPFPQFKEGKSKQNALIYGLGSGTFYMSNKAWYDQKKRTACIKLLKALTSKDSAYLLATPSRTGMLVNVKLDKPVSGDPVSGGNLADKGQLMLENAKELIGPPDHFVDRSIWDDKIVQSFPYLFAGNTTPKQVWKDVQEQYNTK